MARTNDPFDITFYEGLIYKTASMYAPYVEDEFDDICQLLRMKVWRALELYDASRSRMPVERYVFMCVKNRCKDLVTKQRRGEVYVEDQRRSGADTDGTLDWFESRYLSADHEQTFGGVDDGAPLIPSTLDSIERHVLVLLYRDHTQAETARALGLRRSEMERTMRSIRAKMADWRPAVEQPVAVAA